MLGVVGGSGDEGAVAACWGDTGGDLDERDIVSDDEWVSRSLASRLLTLGLEDEEAEDA